MVSSGWCAADGFENITRTHHSLFLKSGNGLLHLGLVVSLHEAGDIYLVSLDPIRGREQRGNRPVLVVSPEEFNRATKLPVVLPMTNGGEFAKRIGFAVPISGIKTTGVVHCDQPRVLDLKARKGKKMDTLPPAILDEVLGKVATIFE